MYSSFTVVAIRSAVIGILVFHSNVEIVQHTGTRGFEIVLLLDWLPTKPNEPSLPHRLGDAKGTHHPPLPLSQPAFGSSADTVYVPGCGAWCQQSELGWEVRVDVGDGQ